MKNLAVSEAKAHFSSLLEEVDKIHEVVSISKEGRPKGVLMSYDEYESLIETLEILSDPELLASIRRSEREIKSGKLLPLVKLPRD